MQSDMAFVHELSSFENWLVPLSKWCVVACSEPTNRVLSSSRAVVVELRESASSLRKPFN